jgi:hypothetical protein
MPDPRSREKAVADLHRFYGRKQLRVLVGNGVSIPSGFPPWDSLNLGLLEVLIRADSRDRNLWAGLIEPELPKLTRSLYDVLGRNGAADFVRMTSPRRFKHLDPGLLWVVRRSLPSGSLESSGGLVSTRRADAGERRVVVV